MVRQLIVISALSSRVSNVNVRWIEIFVYVYSLVNQSLPYERTELILKPGKGNSKMAY